jgi:uncharacterized protein YdeI (YjbR/CyaY-like superfamily)
MPASKSFSTPVERLRSRLNWLIIRVPFDVDKAWGSGKRPKVRGEINGFPFRTSLFPFSKDAARDLTHNASPGHFLLINKQMQRGGKLVLGSVAKVRLEPDTEERTVAMPPQLKRALAEDKSLVSWFDQFNYSIRKWICDWVADPKSPDARQRRAEQVCEQLLATMEAERDLPPIIRTALARNPQAEKGWALMTPSQRRAQLLAVFYYRSPEARARRLDKVLDLARQRAERETNRSED